jgi:endoglucanase
MAFTVRWLGALVSIAAIAAACGSGTGGSNGGSDSGAGGTGGVGGSGGSAGGTGGSGGAAAGGSGGSGGSSDSGPGRETGAGGTGGSGGSGDSGGTGGSGQDGGASSGVHAVGNQVYDGTKAIRLLGVNETGTQYACIQGDGIFDPANNTGANSATSITAMLAWGINAVRIPLNEDCWLSLNGVDAAYGGANYQTAIQTYVTTLLTNGIYPILDLHWTEGADGSAATAQQPMPDATNATAFWTSVATMFKSQNKVIFDLFNEPYPDDNMDATSAWQCWGATTTSSCPGVSFDVVGMQGMLTAVRNAGANNLIVMGGLEYSNDLSQWLTYKPTDPAQNIAASWHVYTGSNYTSSHSLASDAAFVLGSVPIVATEIGDSNTPPACNGVFINQVMSLLDAPGTGIPPQSYLAWSWSTDNMPALLSSYDPVTATCDGPYFKTHVMSQE